MEQCGGWAAGQAMTYRLLLYSKQIWHKATLNGSVLQVLWRNMMAMRRLAHTHGLLAIHSEAWDGSNAGRCIAGVMLWRNTAPTRRLARAWEKLRQHPYSPDGKKHYFSDQVRQNRALFRLG